MMEFKQFKQCVRNTLTVSEMGKIIFATRKKLTSAVLVSFSWSMNTLRAHITKSPGSAWSATSPQENASKLLLCSPKQLNHFPNATLGLRNVAGLVSIPGRQKWCLCLVLWYIPACGKIRTLLNRLCDTRGAVSAVCTVQPALRVLCRPTGTHLAKAELHLNEFHKQLVFGGNTAAWLETGLQTSKNLLLMLTTKGQVLLWDSQTLRGQRGLSGPIPDAAITSLLSLLFNSSPVLRSWRFKYVKTWLKVEI